MNTTTINIDREQARRKLREYRGALHKRADSEYEQVAEAYQAAADGKRLVDLNEAIREGGFDEKWQPKLAVARADRQRLQFSWDGRRRTIGFDANGRPEFGGRRYPQLVINVDVGRTHPVRFKAGDDRSWPATLTAWTLVPLVPPEVRQRVKGYGTGANFLVLFEVESWHDSMVNAGPNGDPFLLREIRHPLYAVEAEWDLTELEKYVMTGRRHA